MRVGLPPWKTKAGRSMVASRATSTDRPSTRVFWETDTGASWPVCRSVTWAPLMSPQVAPPVTAL